MKWGLTLITLVLIMLPTVLKAATADQIIGLWLNQDKDAKIEIYKTTSGKYAGKIAWMKNPNDENGNPKVDNLNPDPKLRTRLRFGLVIMSGLAFDEGKWEDGKIYDPKNGKTYSCKAELIDENTLHLRGFLGVSLLGRTNTWTRSKL